MSLEEEYLMVAVIHAMIDEYPAWRLVVSKQDLHTLQMDAAALALENGEIITEDGPCAESMQKRHEGVFH